MKYFFKTIIFLFIVSSCKVETKKIANTSENIISTSSEKEVVQQQKDTVRKKSAIGKSYNKYLHEIEEFKKFTSRGGWSVTDYQDDTSKYSGYILSTLDIFEENKEEGTSIRKGTKYVVMVNNKVVIDYIDVEKIDIPKDYFLSDEVWLNDEIDREIFAYVRYDDSGEQFVTDIYKAFRADKETGKIFEVPSKGMKAENGDYGF
ncbi:hypothetical protein [Aquimarina algicola]|uniref:Lipoprotein n=1 Tax=Aquimarina algicola TaxID=2589995 RepID=A0A504J4H6_9FLAO|nr:hypothetical protein [Aquimarina algicola]TPN85856.1 hypothetical protein FHK87_11260 [Aquimarina algicola]